MLIRVISDVHSNLPALESVLADRAGLEADVTVCLGDVVGYGSEPSECIRLVRSACRLAVSGNHDAGVAGSTPLSHFNRPGAEVVEWTRGVVEADEMEWLLGLPIHADLGGFFLCHSDPAIPDGWRYILTRGAAMNAMEARPGQASIIGHTHLPGVWSSGGVFSEAESGKLGTPLLINCGSVGQPRDGDPRAVYLLVDSSAGTWKHVRVTYDIEAAAAGIRRAGLPDMLADRLFVGR
jgi:diadenosine tetraphosphatase ApaH/serine/threonine PP2A family protein phosphatase